MRPYAGEGLAFNQSTGKTLSRAHRAARPRQLDGFIKSRNASGEGSLPINAHAFSY
jgi:hypothetical protein